MRTILPRGAKAVALGAAAALCWALGAERARAAFTCEQLYAVLQATVRYRDEGYSLSQVLGALKNVEDEHKLSKPEMDVLQKSVSATYLSQAAPEEVTLECVKSGAFGKADTKSGAQKN